MGGSWDKPNMCSEPGKAKWLVKGNPEEMSHKRMQTKKKKKKKDANYHEGTILQVHPYVYPYILFFFLINTLLVSLLPIFVEDHFYEAKGPRALSLATVPGGLVAKIQCSHHPSLTSVFGQGTKVLLQVTAGWGHQRLRPATDTVLACLGLELSSSWAGSQAERGHHLPLTAQRQTSRLPSWLFPKHGPSSKESNFIWKRQLLLTRCFLNG